MGYNKAGCIRRAVDTLEVTIDLQIRKNRFGEIVLRGENVMTGYIKTRPATKAVIDEKWMAPYRRSGRY